MTLLYSETLMYTHPLVSAIYYTGLINAIIPVLEGLMSLLYQRLYSYIYYTGLNNPST